MKHNLDDLREEKYEASTNPEGVCCPLCNSKKIELIINAEGQRRHCYQCSDCGLEFL